MVGWLVATAAAQEPRPEVAEILVPADNYAVWPAGDWVTISRGDYDALRTKARPRPVAPRPAWIEQAEYTAEFAGDALRAGTLAAHVRHTDHAAQLVALDPLGLTVDSLWWDAPPGAAPQEALWGTTADGRTALLVDRPDTTLHGRWSLAGRPLSRGTEFDVRLMPATVSRLRLRVPAGFVLESSVGDVVAEETDDPQVRRYTVHLGSQSRCRLRLVPASNQEPPRPQVLVESDVTHLVRRDGLQLQARFTLDVLKEPVSRLVFRMPAEIEPYSVSWGSDTQLAWKTNRRGPWQTLIVDLPEPVIGKSRAVRIQGLAPARLGQRWALPRITLQGGSFLGGQYHLSVERPLQVQSMQTRGYRQTATVARRGEGATYTFNRYAPDVQFDIVIDHPPLDVLSRVVSLIDVAAENWSLAADVTWQVRAGSTFTTRCAIAPTWEVTEVHRLADGSGQKLPVTWDVQPAAERGSVLLLEFPESLSEGASRTVRVLARRSAAASGEPARLPVVQPLGQDPLDEDRPERLPAYEGLLAVIHRPSDTPHLTDALSLVPVDRDAAPDFARGSSLWPRLAAETDRQVRLLYGTTAATRGTLAVESAEPPLDAAASLIFHLTAGRVAQQLALDLQPQGEPVETVLVYLTAATEPMEWTLPGEPDATVTERRLPASRHDEWDLPETGALWELRLSRPLAEAFRLVARRTAPVVPGEELLLASVPQAREFAATVELRTPGEADWDVEARGLRALAPESPRPPSESAGVHALRRWRYRSLADGTRLRVREARPDAARGRVASLQLRSLLAPAGGGHDLHEALYRIPTTDSAATFRFTLPETGTLLDTAVNGETVTALRRGTEFLVPLPPREQPGAVRVRYRAPAPEGLIRQVHSIPLPGVLHEILEFQWTVAVPPDARPAALPGGVRWQEPLSDLAWTERLFGPLGRPAGQPVFNPLRPEAWAALGNPSTTEPSGRPRTGATGLMPEGWAVWQASAPRLPGQLTLAVWDGARVRVLAWLCLLTALAAGLMLRLGRMRHRQRVAAVWLGAAAALAWVLPAGWAELAGGCVAGTLLAVLLPRRFLFRPAKLEGSEGSTIAERDSRIRSTAALGVLLTAGLTTSFAAGQPAAPAVPEMAVMIPVGPDGQPVGKNVYVTRRLKERFEQLAAPEPSSGGYLITAAEYRGRVDRQNLVTVEARYRLAVLPSHEPVPITLPLSGGHLSGPDACRVNGTPHDVLNAEGRDALLIELENEPHVPPPDAARDLATVLSAAAGPGAMLSAVPPLRPSVREVEVVLTLYVPPTIAPRGGRFALQIPAVADSRLAVTFDPPAPHRDVVGSRGVVDTPDDGRTLRAALGPTDQFEVVWSDDAEPRPEQVPLEAQVACLVEAQPAALQLRYRVAYSGLRGGVGSVAWQIPDDLVPRIPADAPYTWSLRPAEGRRQLFVVDFTTPQTGPFTLDVTFLLPLRAHDGTVRVPRIVPTAPATAVSSDMVGVFTAPTTPFFTLTAQTTDQEGLERIAASTFAESFQRGMAVPDLKTPEVAWQMTKPVEPVFRLEPIAPRRRVLWQEQIGRITPGSLAWTMTAQIETTAAPAFRHTLRVDPALQIQSISVKEDETERLLHWTRQGARVVLFLSDKTAGRQTIRLEGLQPLVPRQAAALPLVRVDADEVVDSQLTLLRSDELTVDVQRADALSPLDIPPPPGMLGDTVRPVGQYRVLADAAPQIVVRRREDRPRVDTATTILTGPSGERRLRTALRIDGHIAPPEPVRVQIPAALAEGHELAVSGAEFTLEPQRDRSIDVLVHSPPDAGRAAVVTLTTPLPATDDNPWELPPVPVFGAEAGSHYLLASQPDAGQPQGSDVAAVPAAELPEWIGEALPPPAGQETWTVFRAEQLPWKLANAAAETESAALRIALLETHLWLERDGTTWGTSTLVLPASASQRLTLAWPAGLTLRAALVDGRPVPATPAAATGELSLLIESSPVPRTVVLSWTRAKTANSDWFRPQTAALPYPVNLAPEHSVLSVIAPDRHWIARETGWHRVSAFAQALERLKGHLAALPGATAAGREPSPIRQAAVRQSDRLARALAERRRGPGLTAAEQEIAGQLRTLADQIEALRPEADSPPDTPSVPEFETAPAGDVSSGAWRTGRRTLARGQPVDPTQPLQFWTLRTATLQVLLGLAIGLLTTVLFWKLLKPQRTDWLHTRPALACLLLGLAWWALLTPSLLGVGLLLLAGWPLVRHPRRLSLRGPARY